MRTANDSRISWALKKLFPNRVAVEGRSVMVLGVFLLFSTIGFQLELLHREPLSWTRGVASAALAGTIAAMWLIVGTYHAWLLVPAGLGLQLLVFPRIFNHLEAMGLFQVGAAMEPRRTTSLMILLSIVMLAVGFFLIMRSVVRAVRRSQAARAELAVARSVHQFIVPPIDLSAAGVRVLARSRTSSTMGGDLIDVVTREGEVDVFLADVSGHGVKAGIVMAMLKAAVRTRLTSGGDLGAILRDVNLALGELIEPSMFATLACVRVRPMGSGTALVEYALAGHLPILHVCARNGTIRELANEWLPLGIEAREGYASGRTEARSGDVLVMLTDGLTEVQGKDGKELGLREVREVVRVGGRGTLEELHRVIMARVDGHGAQIDDQTLALVGIE